MQLSATLCGPFARPSQTPLNIRHQIQDRSATHSRHPREAHIRLFGPSIVLQTLSGCLTALFRPEYGHSWRVSPEARLESGQQVFENCIIVFARLDDSDDDRDDEEEEDDDGDDC